LPCQYAAALIAQALAADIQLLLALDVAFVVINAIFCF
jgi:hypothetical protein